MAGSREWPLAGTSLGCAPAARLHAARLVLAARPVGHKPLVELVAQCSGDDFLAVGHVSQLMWAINVEKTTNSDAPSASLSSVGGERTRRGLRAFALAAVEFRRREPESKNVPHPNRTSRAQARWEQCASSASHSQRARSWLTFHQHPIPRGRACAQSRHEQTPSPPPRRDCRPPRGQPVREGHSRARERTKERRHEGRRSLSLWPAELERARARSRAKLNSKFCHELGRWAQPKASAK